MKRFLSMLLAVILVVSLFPAVSLRAEAKTGGKLIAITFDDGPNSKYTKQLLDGLKERGVPVTFFCLGEMAGYNPKLVKRAYEEGHEVACHSWDHPDLTGCSNAELKKQLEDTFEELDKACGDEADYLVRPPYGSTNERVRNAIDAPIIYWSVDSEDWSLLNTDKIRKKIVGDSYDGCIILCHDIHRTTIPAALSAIDELRELGYEFVTVSELYRRRGRELEDHVVHYNSKNNGIDLGPIPAPVITVTGHASGGNLVTITCADGNAPIYYTLDGSYPNQDATAYTGPFTVPYGTEVTAVAAYKLNGSRSALTKKTAEVVYVAPPIITMDDYGAIVMTTPTADAEICFTVDNTPADASDLPYTGPEFLEGPCHLRAVAVSRHGVSTESRAYLGDQGSLFYDISGEQWFFESMEWAYESGIMNGIAPYTMDPAGSVTRGMLVTLLYRFSFDSLGSNWERTNDFEDVNQSFYYAEAIEWAYRNGIVDGYSPTAFGPDDKVTRQQMCKIVSAFLSWSEMPLLPAESCESQFVDYDQVASWAKDSVDAMVAEGLIQGADGRLNPNDGANRAQFCVLLLRLNRFMEDYWQEPEPSEPTEPTEPEPTEPEPTVPEHTHEWKINKTDVSIDVGERFRLYLYCTGVGCDERPEVVWTPSTEGVVTIDGIYITGAKAGWNTWLRTEVDGVTYECIVRVRKSASNGTEAMIP